MDAAPPILSPSKADQLRKDARRFEHSIERSLNDFNRKLLLLKASSAALTGGAGGAEQQPLMQHDPFAEAEATATDIEQELKVPCAIALNRQRITPPPPCLHSQSLGEINQVMSQTSDASSSAAMQRHKEILQVCILS